MEVKTKNENCWKAGIFAELAKHNVEAEITLIQTEKVKLKNAICNESYNIQIKNGDYRIVDMISSELIKRKKLGENRGKSFNITSNTSIKPGSRIPVKFIYLNNKVYTLPCNKINFILFFSRKFEFIYEKMEKFLKVIQSGGASSLHITLQNLSKDGLLEHSQECQNIIKTFGIPYKGLSYSIAYDSKFRVIWTGSMEEIMDEKKLQEIMNYDHSTIKNKNTNAENESDQQINVSSKLSLLTLDSSKNPNVITEENKLHYKSLKEEIKKLNRKELREIQCKLKGVEIKLTRFKKYLIIDSKSSQKIIFKPNIEYNEKASIKDKTGKFIDNLILNYKEVMNFISHEDEEDFQKYVKCGIDFYYENILIPLKLVGKVKLGISCEEILGLCNRRLKYTIYNKTPFSELIGLNVYFTAVLPAIAQFIQSINKEVKDAVVVKSNFYSENNRKIVLPYLDENYVEKALEVQSGEVTILNLLTVYNPVFLQMLSYSLPVIEKIRRTTTSILPKINNYLVVFCDKNAIEFLKNSPEINKLKEYAKGELEIIYVDPASQIVTWMQYCHLEDLGTMVISEHGKRHHLNSDGILQIESTLKSVFNKSINYELDQKTFYELKEYGKKLVKVKLNDLDYNPNFSMHLSRSSEIDTNNERIYLDKQKVMSYSVNFVCKIRRKDKGGVIPFTKRIKKILILENDLDLLEELYDVVDIELGHQCNACKKELVGLEELQYYCHWCKVHFCQDCGNKYNHSDLTVPIQEQLPHKHFLAIIKVKNLSGLKNIDTYKFGYNIWDKFYYAESILNTFNCNGCSQTCYSSSSRYICLNCRPGPLKTLDEDAHDCGFVDFCEACVKLMTEGDWRSNQKLVKEIAKDNHDCESHIYLRVDAPTGNYSVY